MFCSQILTKSVWLQNYGNTVLHFAKPCLFSAPMFISNTNIFGRLLNLNLSKVMISDAKYHPKKGPQEVQ